MLHSWINYIIDGCFTFIILPACLSMWKNKHKIDATRKYFWKGLNHSHWKWTVDGLKRLKKFKVELLLVSMHCFLEIGSLQMEFWKTYIAYIKTVCWSGWPDWPIFCQLGYVRKHIVIFCKDEVTKRNADILGYYSQNNFHKFSPY